MTRKPCMVVRLSDGLGNQLFQFAFGRALQHETGARVWFDRSAYASIAEPRRYRLDRLGLTLPFVRQEAGIDFDTNRVRIRRPLRYRIRRSPFERLFRLVTETKDFVFDPGVLEHRDDCYFLGYWQARGYFLDRADAINGEIRLPFDRLDNTGRAWLDGIRSGEAVAVHVRRGDYSTPHIRDIHGLCRMPYYVAAMERVKQRRPAATFFVFSDDPAWCRHVFSGFPVRIVDAHSSDLGDLDLALMASCRHHIIANSSFSWWAAWLARHETQTVVAPTPWTTRDGPAPDLLPDSWIVLDRDTGLEGPRSSRTTRSGLTES